MRRVRLIIAIIIYAGASASGAQVSLHLVPSDPPSALRMDILWTMQTTDTAAYDLDAFYARFNVEYPAGATGQLIVNGVSTLPGWTTEATMGNGGPLGENFFLAVDDTSGTGISGDGTEFSTIVASVFLLPSGNVAGTEITFRHNSPNDLLPLAADGPNDWILRWQSPVTGPFQFDIGSGNPGDSGSEWDPYHGYETASPVTVFPPEPSSLALLLLAAFAVGRGGDASRRHVT